MGVLADIASSLIQRSDRLLMLPRLQFHLCKRHLKSDCRCRLRITRRAQILPHLVVIFQLRAGARRQQIIRQRCIAVLGAPQ